MITPRTTRLVRVATLHDFRRALTTLCAAPVAEADAAPSGLPSRLVIVPSRASARTLADTVRTLSGLQPDAELSPALAFVTRDELYDALHARLGDQPARLSPFERDVMAQSAAVEAASEVGDLPFRVRPGLVAEMLRFYDQLRRQSQTVLRFKQRMNEALGGGELDDRGADRLLRQTQFLASAFAGYEQRAAAAQAYDEHRLRDRLLADATAAPLAHVIVTVPDWIADPSGLFVADFDLLSQLPNLAAIDIVATEATLGSGFHERLHERASRRRTLAARLAECVLFTLSEAPKDPHLAVLLRSREHFTIAAALRLSFVQEEIVRLAGGAEACTLSPRALDELAELLLRLLHSFLTDPGEPRDEAAQRAYLLRVIEPVVASLS